MEHMKKTAPYGLTSEQYNVLQRAAEALTHHDKLKAELRAQETHLNSVCRDYGSIYRIWGFRPEHMRMACAAHGLIT